MKTIEVVAAIIVKDNLIFCAKRNNIGETANMWEFPGGKIEPNESHKDALKREIKEELNSLIKVEKFFMTVEYSYNNFDLTMHSYICTLVDGELELKEHTDSCWLSINKLNKLDWAKADIPIVNKLIENI